MGILRCRICYSVAFVAGYDVVHVGSTHASSRRRAGNDDCVHEDAVAVVDDGSGDDGSARHGEPDGERQRDVGLPEEHAQSERRSQRAAR